MERSAAAPVNDGGRPSRAASKTAVDAGFRVITPVWGEQHTDCFVSICLPALMAPGNIPVLEATSNNSYHIYTTPEDRLRIEACPAYRRLTRYLPVIFHAIHSGVPESANPYAMQSDAYRDGIRNADAADAAMIFLNADVLLANGGIRTLVRIAGAGKRVALAMGIRTNRESMASHLVEQFRSTDGAVLSIEPRDLVGLALSNLHPITRAHLFHGEDDGLLPGNLLWRVGEEGVLGRCFHLHPVVVFPRRKGASFSIAIDVDFLEAACPDPADFYTIVDSDEFFACELTAAGRRITTLPRTGDPRDIARWAYYNTGGAHRELVKQAVRIHAGAVDAEQWKAVEQESGETVSRVLRDVDDPRLFQEQMDSPARRAAKNRLPLHMVTPVWGAEYSELFVNVTLPTILSPGNIPAVPNRDECRYVIYTDAAGRGIIENSRAYAILRENVAAEIRLIDEKVANKYVTSSNCYREAIREAARSGAAAVFLIPDMILADGSIRNITRILRGGKRQILITGTRLVKETVVPRLLESYSTGGVVSIAPGDLIRLALDHIHPITKTHLYEGDSYGFHPSVMSWRVGTQGMVLRCFHLHPVAVVPTADTFAFEGTIDDDLMENSMLYHKDVHIVTDSDEVQWCEMSPLDRRVPTPPRAGIDAIVHWMTNSTSVFHRSLIYTTIRVHTGSCGGGEWQAVEAKADVAVQMVMARYYATLDPFSLAKPDVPAEKSFRALLSDLRILLREFVSLAQRYLAKRNVLRRDFPLSILYFGVAGGVVGLFLVLRTFVRLARATRTSLAGERNLCKLCQNGRLQEIEGYVGLARVTSDARPWPPGGHIAYCGSCGAIQKIPDAKWSAETAAIYRDYQSYPLSGGLEQNVYDPASGAAKRRSLQIAEHLVDALRLGEQGSILDLGCGNGVTLDAFSRLRPAWHLYGQDLDDKSLPTLKKLPGFRALYTGTPGSIEGQHTVVSLIHAFEHFPDPQLALRQIRHLIAPDGWLFIQVPDCRANPFDLVVADHLLHFTLDTLALMVEAAGYRIHSISDSLVPKELSVAARAPSAGHGPGARRSAVDPGASSRMLFKYLDWLRWCAADAERASALGHFGLFGTAIAATWMFGIIGRHVRFFVDEDPNRVGNEYMGCPVLSPAQMPAGSHVYLPLAPAVARSVYSRLRHLPVTFHLPPDL